MVSDEDERWECYARKEWRDACALRISRTDWGSDWLGRINAIGRFRPRKESNHMKTRKLQKELNQFTRSHLKFVTPLRVDGKRGPSTDHRIQTVKYYLGYQRKARTGDNASKIDAGFLRRLEHPDQKSAYQYDSAFRRALKRRRWQKAHATPPKPPVMNAWGLGMFDGKPVAKAAIPYLNWARKNGWRGLLVSGWRSRAYSQHLCYVMCGAPACPGRCAGVNTNHVYSQPDRFAIDVSDYGTFGRLMQRCPLKPQLHNYLGSRDPVHFSPSGN
jgi:hypothetical protein